MRFSITGSYLYIIYRRETLYIYDLKERENGKIQEAIVKANIPE